MIAKIAAFAVVAGAVLLSLYGAKEAVRQAQMQRVVMAVVLGALSAALFVLAAMTLFIASVWTL